MSLWTNRRKAKEGLQSEAALPHPAATRPRLEEASASSPTKRSTETLPVGTSKVQRMASVTFAKTKKQFRVCVTFVSLL